MKFKIIASGSKGNCAVVLSEQANIIIDMGISYLTLKRSLEEDSLSLNNFTGILITHCHKDHTNGLTSLIKHTKLKVYIPEKMYDSLKEYISRDDCIFIDDTQKNDMKHNIKSRVYIGKVSDNIVLFTDYDKNRDVKYEVVNVIGKKIDDQLY